MGKKTRAGLASDLKSRPGRETSNPSTIREGLKPGTFGTTAMVLFALAVIVHQSHPTISLLITAIGAACVVAFFVVAAGQHVEAFVDAGRPERDPRSLILLDSWQAVVTDLAGDGEMLRERLRAQFDAFAQAGVVHAPERIGYWTPDGRIERTQYVLALRRGVIFVHVYPYGEDLYIGWDGHLNRLGWREKVIGTGIDAVTRKRTRYLTVESESIPFGEYDLTDANVLMEWVHAKLVRLTKDLLAERRIDQEIDFTIVRGNRQNLGGTDGDKKKPGEGTTTALGSVRRVS